MNKLVDICLYAAAYGTQVVENRCLNRWRPADQAAQGLKDEAEFKANLKRSWDNLFRVKRGRA